MSKIDVERDRRREKVRHILEALPPIEVVRRLREADDLSRSSLHWALDRYVQGIETDSIIHSAFAVEIALILRLDKSLTDKEKETIKRGTIQNKTGFMFGKTISMAGEKSILKDADINKAWKLNNLRNMHAHPANWVAFIKQQYSAALNLEKALPETSAALEEFLASTRFPQDKETIRETLRLALRNVSDYVKDRLEKFPDLEWCASQDTLKFQDKRLQDYFAESQERILSPAGLMELIENAPNIVTYSQTTYPYAGRDAYEALVYAYEILRALTII